MNHQVNIEKGLDSKCKSLRRIPLFLISAITLSLIISPFSFLAFAGVCPIDTTASKGPAILVEICKENNIDTTVEEIGQLAGTDKSITSLWGLKQAAEEKGLIATGLKTDVEKLKELTEKGCVIVLLSRNRTYVRVKGVSEWFVNIHNPSGYPKSNSVSKNIFEKQWDGKALFIQTKEQKEASPSILTIQPSPQTMQTTSGERAASSFDSGGGEITALSGTEMQAAAGGDDCANPPCDPDGTPPGPETADPVILGSGALHCTETDLLIETKGLVPLDITRTYTSQVVSHLDDWEPDVAAGPWAVRDGVYNGYGDRTLTNRSWTNFTLIADIKTVSPGTNQWETAWLNFRYQNESNRYYFLIKTDGILELTRMKSGQMTTLAHKSSSYNPLNWNTIKLIVNSSNIKVYINNNLEINCNDPSPLTGPGSIVLESRFCYAQFDNVSIQSGAENYSYDFNTPDRDEPFGKGWSYSYGMHIQEFQNGDVRVIWEDGKSNLFTDNGDGTYTPSSWLHKTLTKDAEGFTLRQKDGAVYCFDLSGRLEYIEDRHANRITLTYQDIYGASRLKYIIGPAGRQLTFEYWPDGRIKEIKDPTGVNKYQYIYDGIHLVQVMDSRGNSKYYEYDPLMNLRTVYIDRKGNRYEYTYTYNARVETQKDPELNITTFEYWWDTTHVINKDGEQWSYTFYPGCSGLWSITDNLGADTTYTWDTSYNLKQLNEVYGKRTNFEYDDKGNVTKVIDPENGTTYPTEFLYDPEYSLVTYKKDPKGNETTYVYDNGMLTEVHEPLGKTTTMTYYPYGKMKTLTDAEDNLTEFEYDAYGYLKKIKRHTETGVVEKNFTYDIIGNLLSGTDEEGNTKNYTYDKNNNLKEVKDASSNILASYTYDNNDNIETVTNALNHTVSYERDWAGNLTKVTEYDEYSVEHSIEYTYDNKDYLHLGESDLVEVKDQENNITTYQYTKESASDGLRKVVIETDAEERVTKRQYNRLGNLAFIEDAAGKKSYYYFDHLTRLKKILYPDSTYEEYTYDRASNLQTKRDRKTQVITYQHDALNRLEHKIYPDSTQIDYTYDKINNLKTVVSPNGTTTMIYDKLSRLTDATYPGGKVVSYEYYDNGLRKKLIYPDSSFITYHYDPLIRLTDIKDSSAEIIAHYDYDGLTSRRHALTYMNDAPIEYGYNKLSRVISVRNKLPSSAVFSQFDYTYNKVGNRTSMTSNEGLHQYYYDKTYQLIDVTYPDLRTGHYEYDDMGNRVYIDDRGEHLDYTLKTNGLNQYNTVSKTKHNIDIEGTVRGDNPTVTVNGMDAIVSGEEFLAEDVTLNSGSNLILAEATDASGTFPDSISVNLNTSSAKSFLYDNNGSLKRVNYGGKQTTYTYDYENRLKILSQTQGPNAAYKYDYLGRRIEKNVDGVVTKYIYDGNNVIAEYDGTDTLIAKYVYGPNIDEPIRLENTSGVCYYHYDSLGSVTDLTSNTGQHIEHYYYSPFGETKICDPVTHLKRTDSIVDNPYRFTGRRWDTESKLYYYRARMYSPKLGRFLQVDPIGYHTGNMNLYRYCRNNPLNWIDPWGLWSTIFDRGGSAGHGLGGGSDMPPEAAKKAKKSIKDSLFPPEPNPPEPEPEEPQPSGGGNPDEGK